MQSLVSSHNSLGTIKGYMSFYYQSQIIPTYQFYGIPKIHKKFSHLPPVRLSLSVIHHSPAQPSSLTTSYSDYLHNSTSLILLLQNLTVPDDAILVTMDVNNLYPSIPQTCFNLWSNESMQASPSLRSQPHHKITAHQYWSEFASLIFYQIKGTATGAAFSPIAANIFMSVTIRRFLRTQNKRPLLSVRYIDDIFMIWTHTEDDLKKFLTDLNGHNPALSYIYHYSLSTVNFLDLTIYKSPRFAFTNILDSKMFQKPHNLYQYLHYTSSHQRSVYKAIISGELVKYVRTRQR